METIKPQKCKLCDKLIIEGKMAQAPNGYACEVCCRYMCRMDLVTIEKKPDSNCPPSGYEFQGGGNV